MDSSPIECKAADFGSPEQLASIELRRRILRWPLGLDFTPEQLASEMHEYHLVALQGEDLLACLVLTPQDRQSIKMRQVAVETELQGKGVGRKLVEFSEQVAKDRGFAR